MVHDIEFIRKAAAELRQAWCAASGFFLSIELWLMVLAAASMVAGFWLAFMGEPCCLGAFGIALGYAPLRIVLHLKGRLAWPFF